MSATARPLSGAAVASTADELAHLLEEVSHLLPAQAPIRRFVHHNTLHHFQHLPFEEAVVEGAKTFGCEPFPTEEFFARERARGRILDRDLEAVLKQESDRITAIDPSLPYEGWSRSTFRSFRLAQVMSWPGSSEIAFSIREGEALRAFWPGVEEKARERFLRSAGTQVQALSTLWEALLEQCPRVTRVSDDNEGVVESAVHAFLIRFCGAYLDQGIGYWPMPRQSGLYATFLALYSQSSISSPPWLAGLSAVLRKQLRQGQTAEGALEEALGQLGVAYPDRRAQLEKRALSLRGWAGMVHQMETRPDLAPVEAPAVRLMDYMAIFAILEVQARRHFGPGRAEGTVATAPSYERAYEAFVLAQLAGFGPATLDSSEKVASWLHEVAEFPEVSRRRLLLWAYERRYRMEILDGVSKHCQLGEYRATEAPKFQAVFCIDDREESTRRHLEEIETRVQTMGMAGFFGVRMSYQGWNDTHPLPLCPANAAPQHLVCEVPISAQPAAARKLGLVQQSMRAGRNGVLSGGLLSTTAGFLSGFSLVGRTLAPGLFSKVHHGLEQHLAEAPLTRLLIERPEGQPKNSHGLFEGFTVSEMTAIVKGALVTMGSTTIAPLFLIVGHGSSSLNNPHEAAHDCGATGGGRGGPNARAFAAMANHPEVRKALAGQGIVIPETSWFVGSYHNTCDDSMEYFDVDLIPQSLAEDFLGLRQAMEKACVMDAHERCRRFHNVSLGASPQEAYQHVQARAVTLAQPRPEYGHCTNSICVVGRRERTRGLFLDRRAFLVSYDPSDDGDGSVLGSVLESVGPVGAGINLEYYFSSIDCAGYGCGTKLPHNITGLLGVMDGHSSDLRTGLPRQMVEIHEPMRLLIIVEAMPALLETLMGASAGVRNLVDQGWVQLVAWSPTGSELWTYQGGAFVPHQLDSAELSVVDHSRDYYGGHRGHLPPARIQSAFGGRP